MYAARRRGRLIPARRVAKRRQLAVLDVESCADDDDLAGKMLLEILASPLRRAGRHVCKRIDKRSRAKSFKVQQEAEARRAGDILIAQEHPPVLASPRLMPRCT